MAKRKKIKKKTPDEISCMFTQQEFINFLTEKDKIQGREKTAAELGCTKYVLREVARRVGMLLPHGRPARKISFKQS